MRSIKAIKQFFKTNLDHQCHQKQALENQIEFKFRIEIIYLNLIYIYIYISIYFFQEKKKKKTYLCFSKLFLVEQTFFHLFRVLLKLDDVN